MSTIELPNSTAFIANGYHVSFGQRAAGFGAMRGRFDRYDVMAAMRQAGLAEDALWRASDRLMQAERKAGRIRRTADKNAWEQIA